LCTVNQNKKRIGEKGKEVVGGELVGKRGKGHRVGAE